MDVDPGADDEQAKSRPERLRGVSARRYTRIMLLVVGAAVGLVMWVLDVWWGLIVGIVVAFSFGAALTFPWSLRRTNARAGARKQRFDRDQTPSN